MQIPVLAHAKNSKLTITHFQNPRLKCPENVTQTKKYYDTITHGALVEQII